MRNRERIGSGGGFFDPLDLLRDCGAFYACPKDAEGRRLGPLVGYAGRDGAGRQFVGEVYVNMARAERHPGLLADFSRRLLGDLRDGELGAALEEASGFCGAPEGGKAFAYQLALDTGRDYIYPEKKVTAVATATAREETALAFDRHEPEPGRSWFIVEDVCNNFSTTAKLVELIESHGTTVAGVLCILNRSEAVEARHEPRPGLVLPVAAVVRRAFAQYRQDDPFVSDDIGANNVVWSPKRDWPRLARAMAAVR